MLINITGTGDKRTLTVTDASGVLFEAKGLKLADAHKLAKIGLAHGWDSPELAKAVK